ncbi:hypothetical protein [Labedaea rhizosphaerae]|uniref:Uncharacterized protein n=1 Tax=Labedaea rhizosphaerae TaxID=598644 RepID=A0A4R6SAP3_LABRH|nr:hypothetical protein [Labedaea rhizosphaerae]TDP96593.1 hypothetical protein EV186_104581 [Labedaea rhizosphaerae]
MTEHPILLLRLKRGVVGESQRTLHVVPVPETSGLRAYCGLVIDPAAADAFPEPEGQPCFECLMYAPVPGLRA